MREFKGSEIRNIAVVGHGASGKTSLVDALAFVSGSSKRHGSVKDGTALTDHAAEEIDLGFSINLGSAYAELRQPDRAAECWREAAAAMREVGDHDQTARLEQLAANARARRRCWRTSRSAEI